MTTPPNFPETYAVAPGLPSNPWAWFAGAIGLVGVSLGGFALAVYGRGTGPLQLHLMSTVPMIFAVGLFAAGYRLARAPREVTVSGQGLALRTRQREERLDWDAIARADVQTQAITSRKLLVIYGTGGKPLVKLPASLDRFDALVALVKQRLHDHPSPHATAVQWRKSRRTAVAMLVAAVVALAGATWTAWTAYDANRSAELMRTHGVDGEGVVVRKFLAPDGRTHRIEYRVAGAGDNAELHNVEVDPLLWTILQTQARVPVRTVPGHPEIAQLQVGEVKDPFLNPSPTMSVLLSIGVFAMFLLFLFVAILGFKGMDIATDPTTGKLKINRLPR